MNSCWAHHWFDRMQEFSIALKYSKQVRGQRAKLFAPRFVLSLLSLIPSFTDSLLSLPVAPFLVGIKTKDVQVLL